MIVEPHWTAMVSAIAIAMVALFGAYIAWNLWQTNHNFLREKLFDRRFDIFRKTQALITNIASEEGLSWRAANEFSEVAQQARFMFSTEDAQYFDLLRRKAMELAKATAETDGVRLVGHAATKESRHELCGWFNDQVEEIFSRMSKYLLFDK